MDSATSTDADATMSHRGHDSEAEERTGATPAQEYAPSATRKRAHAGADAAEGDYDAAEDGARTTKRARAAADTTLLGELAANPARAVALIGSLDASAVATIEGAVHARNHTLELAERVRRETASPFNPSCEGCFAVFGDIFREHVLPHVAPEDTCALRLQSRAVRDWVDASGRVSPARIAFALKTPSMCHTARAMVDRMLRHTDACADVCDVVVSAAMETADADVSADIIEDLLSRVTSQIRGATRFAVLYYCISPFTRSTDGARMKWSDVTSGVRPVPAAPSANANSDNDDDDDDDDDDDSGSGSEGGARTPRPKSAIHRWIYRKHRGSPWADGLSTTETRMQKSLVQSLWATLFSGGTRVSPRLMKVLLGNRMLGKWGVCSDADNLATAMIRSMAHRETAGLPIERDVAALEFLLEFLDDCAVRGTGFPRATVAVTECRVSAPLIDILRVPVVTKKRAAGPLTLAAKKNNPVALAYIARRALAEGVSNKAQMRVVSLVARAGYFECLRVLCDELFVVAPATLVKLMIGPDLAWATDMSKRTIAFDAVLADVGMCIARGSLHTMIAQLDDAMAVQVHRTRRSAFFGRLPHITADEWGTTIAGDFLSALWRATSGDARMRNSVCNMKPFREAVNHALIAHLACKLVPSAYVFDGAPGREAVLYNDADSVSAGMAALLSRVAELFDMQRSSDQYIDLEDGSAEASADADALFGVDSMHGAVLDRWLRNLFVCMSTAGMCYIDAAAAATDEIASIFATDTVHTDSAFITSVEGAYQQPSGLPLVNPLWLRALLFKACGAAPTSADLARRLIRWCVAVERTFLPPDAPEAGERPRAPAARGTYLMLADIATCITAKRHAPHGLTPADIVMQAADAYDHKSDVPVATVQAALAALARLLKEFVVDVCGEALGGVEILYLEYGGDAGDALASLTAEFIDEISIPQPQGAVRDIVVYAMASERTAKSADVTAIINKTVARYTEGVTLPCAWSVFGELGGVSSSRNMSRWLRDLLRGRKEHTVWWLRKPT